MKVDWSDDFESLYKRDGQQKYGIRLLALWKIQSGMSERKVGKLLGKTQQTLRRWRRRYEASGLPGLLNLQAGRGRKPILSDADLLTQEIASLEQQQAGGRLTGKAIQLHLAKQGITYSDSGIYKALHRLGYSWITSRSKHPNHDAEKIEAFKKTSKAKSNDSSPLT